MHSGIALCFRSSLLALVIGTTGCAFPLLHGEAKPRSTREHGQEAARYEEQGRTQQTTRPAERRHASVLHPPSAELEHAPASCYEALHRAGIAFERVPEREANGVAYPLRLLGPVQGVSFEPAGGNRLHGILDCRLALALSVWAKSLRQAGVQRVEHYSIYRPGARVGGSGKPSGHAHGLAIDAARFTLDDGSVLDVLTDWEDRRRGASPCPMRPDEAYGSRLLRSVTCSAVDTGLFQVVITPHHDRAHGNHLHLERKPDVDWTYVR